MSIERQELHCHACDRYVQFDIDTELNGRHVLQCPNCGHEHCRIVRDGAVTDERWGQRNALPVYTATNITTTATTFTLYAVGTSAGTMVTGLWLQAYSA